MRIVALVALAGIALVVIGVFMPASCPRVVGCKNINDTAMFSFSSFKNVSLGDGFAANYIGVNLFIVALATAFAFVGDFENKVFQRILAVVLLLMVANQYYFYFRTAKLANATLGWGWIPIVLGTLVVVGAAFIDTPSEGEAAAPASGA